MKEEKLRNKIEEKAKIFKSRALKSPNDGKRHDRVRPDEQKWMHIVHKQLGWSFAKIGSVFDRAPRATKQAVESYQAIDEASQQQPYQETLHKQKMRELADRLDIAQRKQLSDFIASLSLPTPFLIQTADFFKFIPGRNYHQKCQEVYRGKFRLLSAEECIGWLKHALLSQTREVFAQEAVWAELNNFLGHFDELLSNCQGLWQKIYGESRQVVTSLVKLDEPSNNFIPYIYEDAFQWTIGKKFTPVEKDYYECHGLYNNEFQVVIPGRAGIATFKCEPASEGNKICDSIRDNHISLRKRYRASEGVRVLVETMYELETERSKIESQFKDLANVLTIHFS